LFSNLYPLSRKYSKKESFKVPFGKRKHGASVVKKREGIINTLAAQSSAYLFVMIGIIAVFNFSGVLVGLRKICVSQIFGWLAAFGVGYLLKLEFKKNLLYSISIAVIISVITIALSIAFPAAI
jgi:hypothetical protein